MEWRPIETIPISQSIGGADFTEFLVWNTDFMRCEIVKTDEEKRCWWGDWDIPVPASHWMPLPGPPND